MAQVRSSAFLDTVLTELDLSELIKSLTADLVCVESEMLATWRVGKSKIHSRSSRNYTASINELVDRLRKIASALFNETEISKVKPYRKKDKVPENYDKYLRVSENMAKLVSQDILYQPDIDHAVAVFDRWLYICKIAFHQHDFFTSSCILNGLCCSSVSLSKIENELCQTSINLFRYYRNILEKSSSLYHKQNKLLKDKLEVIPVLHALTNLYEKLDAKPTKKDKPSSRQVAEIVARKRAVSRNFIFMQKKQVPELDVINDKILTKLYKKFDEKFSTFKHPDGAEEQLSHFDIRSKTLKSLVDQLQKTRKSAQKKSDQSESSDSIDEAVSAGNPFSVANYSNLTDARVELITIWSSLEKIENKYSVSINAILYRVKSILSNVELTDRAMRHQISDEFDLTDEKFDKKLKNIYKKINKLLKFLIKHEKNYGIFFKGDELKITASSEGKKQHFRVIKSRYKLKEVSDSEASFEEVSIPVTKRKMRKEKSAPFEVESKLSRAEEFEQLNAESVRDNAVKDEPIKVEFATSKLSASVIENKVPDISSSLLLLSALEQYDTPRETDLTPSSVRDELDGLRTARSVSEAKRAYAESVKRGGGILTLQQDALISSRVAGRERSGSALFFISKTGTSTSGKGSLSARVEGSAKETGLGDGSGVKIERPNQ